MRIVTVYRSGGDFTTKHVQALQKQIEKWAPLASFECLSDAPIDGVKCIPLKSNWPGWWAKMELFDPGLPGDFLFMDLDTVILGPLDDILDVNELTCLRDFYRDGKKLKEGLGGGLIYLPADARKVIWEYFTANPPFCMRLYSRGDQHLFERFWLQSAKRWQDKVPGQIVSWKVNCARGIPPEARVICFHGKPRPFETGQFLHLYR